MPTISAMVRNSTMMMNLSQRSSSSSTSSVWKSYNTSTNSINSSTSTLSGLIGIRSAVNDMVKSYDTAYKTFHMEFDDAMSDLSKSSADIKSMNFDVDGESALTTSVNEDGTTSTNKSDKLTDVLKGVEDFLSNYNDAIDFFNDNSNISKQMKNMTNVFTDATYKSGLLSSIGILVDGNGKMKIDEDILTNALIENPSKVSRLLGKDGLAGKADRHISFARSQQNKLFPSMKSTLGSALKSSTIYSGHSLIRIQSYSSVGNLLNLWS